METLTLARELAAIAQTGAHFATGRHDRERYQRIGELAAILLAAHSNVPSQTVYDGGSKATAESSESAFFAEASLPELSPSRVLASQLHRFFEAIRLGGAEAQYD